MALPDVTLEIQDNALGLALTTGERTPALIGVSSTGDVETVYSFGEIQALKDTLGEGPLVEAAALYLAVAGGPVICVRATETSAGTASAVTHAGTGLSVMTVSDATGFDSYDVIVTIVTGATNPAAGDAQIQVSLDGGRTAGPVVALPVSGIYPIPNTGLSVTFSAASLVAGDTYSFTTTAPAFNTTSLADAVTALLADVRQWFLLHVIGPAADSDASAAVVAALQVHMDSAANDYRFARALIDAADDTDNDLIDDFASVNADRVGAGAGFANTVSPVNGRQMSRSAAWDVGARLSAVAPSEDAGFVGRGAVPAVTLLGRDERVTPGLDEARFSTLRTHIGLPGFFITKARLLAAPGSDFSLFQYGRVMDIACTLARNSLLPLLNSSVRVDADGAILEKDARAIEARVKGAIDAGLTAPGDISACEVIVDRDANILSTQTIPVTIRITPLGYATFIEVKIGFANPALSLEQ